MSLRSNQPSRALEELATRLTTLVTANEQAPASEKAAAKKSFSTANDVYGNARPADQKGDAATFNKHAATFNTAYANACAVLSGC
jgi:hypothetical protein